MENNAALNSQKLQSCPKLLSVTLKTRDLTAALNIFPLVYVALYRDSVSVGEEGKHMQTH